jgi:DNA-binding MarR family transcriptional regulator
MAGAKTEGNRNRAQKPRENGYRALVRVTGLLDRVMQPYFGRFGISRSQWACLRILHRAEQESRAGLRPVDLGRRLLVRPPSITGLIDRLAHLGYVMSTTSAIDARGKEVRLTAHGRQLVERVLQVHAAQIAKVMGGLDTDGQQQLHDLLQRLAAHLEILGQVGSRAQEGSSGARDAEGALPGQGSTATSEVNQKRG